MRINRLVLSAAALAVVIGAAFAANAQASAESAIRAAAKQNHYVFVTFYKSNDSDSTQMLSDAKSIKAKLGNRAEFVSVDTGDRSNRALLSRYGADRSPIPLTIVIAPNGAITGGFPRQIKNTDFSDVLVSDGTAAVLKAIQARRIAAVCLESSRTKFNKQCSATADGVKSDVRLGGAVDIVKIDPSDRSESRLMKQWKISTDSPNAQLVVVVPPGAVVGRFDGASSKDSVVASLMKSLSGGCGGGSCGPGGCK